MPNRSNVRVRVMEWQDVAAAKDRVVDAARELGSTEIVFRRVDGGENKLAVGFANLRAALKALDELEAAEG